MNEATPKSVPTEKPDYSDFAVFMVEFIAESDRAAVVLGAARIDSQLQNILDKTLLPYPDSFDDLLDGEAPLATFNARIRACHRLGLIDPQFAKLLHVFRRLRNSFAHDVGHSSLSTGPARDRVLALAEPFKDAPFFHRGIALIAEQAEKGRDDIGVVFRAVLSLFCLELDKVAKATKRVSALSAEGIVGRVFRAGTKNSRGS